MILYTTENSSQLSAKHDYIVITWYKQYAVSFPILSRNNQLTSCQQGICICHPWCPSAQTCLGAQTFLGAQTCSLGHRTSRILWNPGPDLTYHLCDQCSCLMSHTDQIMAHPDILMARSLSCDCDCCCCCHLLPWTSRHGRSHHKPASRSVGRLHLQHLGGHRILWMRSLVDCGPPTHPGLYQTFQILFQALLELHCYPSCRRRLGMFVLPCWTTVRVKWNSVKVLWGLSDSGGWGWVSVTCW